MEKQTPEKLTPKEIKPVSQKTAQILPIPKTKKTLIVGLVVAIFLLMCSTGYLAYQNIQLRQQISQAPADLTPTPQPTTTNKIAFSESLAQFCAEGKIFLDKLPFTLGQTLQEEYKIQGSINCFVPDESYASINIQAIGRGSIGRTIYFFHEDSVFYGMGDAFLSLDSYRPATIDGGQYWINVMEPGPHGISTLGIWVELIAEKKDSETGTIVRSVISKVFNDRDFLDLVVKHGEKQTDPIVPEYIVRGPDNPDMFKDEFVELAMEQNAFLELAQYATSDLNGTSF